MAEKHSVLIKTLDDFERWVQATSDRQLIAWAQRQLQAALPGRRVGWSPVLGGNLEKGLRPVFKIVRGQRVLVNGDLILKALTLLVGIASDDHRKVKRDA